MKIDPDGSLCRITSSVKDCSNVVILKVSDDEQKQAPNLVYKLVSLCPNKDECELPSDESDEDVDDKAAEEIKLKEDNAHKNDINKAEDRRESLPKDNYCEKNKSHKEQEFRSYKYRGHNRGWRAHNRNSSYGRRNFPIPSGLSNPQTIDPWLKPLPLLNYSTYSMQNCTESFQPLNTSLNQIHNISSNCDPSSNTFGLLGDSPYSPALNQFQHGNQNRHFIPGQDYYWPSEYHSSNYQRSVSDMQTPLMPGRIKKYRHNTRSNWQNKRKKSGNWKRRQAAPLGQGESKKYYNYDNRK